MSDQPKDCAFQFAIDSGGRMFSDTRIIEDTKLITRAEANELWKKYLPEFIKSLKKGEKPEMGLWINMKNESDYTESFGHVDRDTQTDGYRVWNLKKEFVNID